ncbi:MAG: nitroreductase family protein [Spirochaetes bacterium]|nr:nitroreductase family protein [Spirochaetota bacterium]
MDVFEAIERRHSYRGTFAPQRVPRADLERIVIAGIRAPSGYNAQSTSFVIVDDADLLAKMAGITGSAIIGGAPAAVAVVMDPDATADKEFRFGIEDYAAAAENMLLAVTALGYATVWLDGMLRREDRAAKVGALLGVPASREVRVILPIGVPAELGVQREKKPFAERAWFNAWAAPASPSRTGS